MHPTYDQYAIVGWKAPFSGLFDVEGFFRDIDSSFGDGVNWFIDKGSETLQSGSVGEAFPDKSQSFSFSDLSMNQGELLYFIVDINNIDYCDSTELSLSITSNVVVELPTLAINNATVVEGLDNTAFLTVSLNGLFNLPVTVNYTTTPLNALPGEDYQSQTGTLTIAPNSQTGTISIPIINDALNERDEAFLVTLSDPVNATLDPNAGAGQVVITDTWQAFVTSTLPAGVENLKLSGTGDINGSGNAGDNVLTGNNGKNLLSGKAGNDTLRGGLGKDSLNGGAGNDLLVGGLDKDIVRGGPGNDRFSYTKLEDSLLSGFDKVADFNANEDRFVVKTLPTLFTANAGNVARLKEADLQALLTPDVLANPGDVAQFTYGARTFIAINDVLAGFQGSGDAIVELATNGLTGVLSQGNFALS
ncbi:MAG: hypothetical protein GC158_02725 [Cyanobacteria bacterium RI_101]|nr:hypothetical protein [Cyanobacteria bacterium RI_101]